MSFLRPAAVLLLLFLAAASAQAGTIHPNVQWAIDNAAPDEMLSVIVVHAQQAPDLANAWTPVRVELAGLIPKTDQVVFARLPPLPPAPAGEPR